MLFRSQGIGFLRKDIAKTGLHGVLNTGRWGMNKLSNIANFAERKAVNTAVRDKQKMLAKAEEMKNIAQASLEDLLSGTASPAAKAQHLAAARKDLAAADALLDALELDLRAAVVPYGVKEAIPSMGTLERRIAFIESRPMSKAAAAKVTKAKRGTKGAKNSITALNTKDALAIWKRIAASEAPTKDDLVVQSKAKDILATYGLNTEGKKLGLSK